MQQIAFLKKPSTNGSFAWDASLNTWLLKISARSAVSASDLQLLKISFVSRSFADWDKAALLTSGGFRSLHLLKICL